MPCLDVFHQTLLRDLIAIDTTNPPGNEQVAAEYLARVLSGLGFDCSLQPVAPGRANLVAFLRRGSGPEVVLSGHLDVVHADPAGWRSDPFVLREENKRFFGRGVADMKGAVSAMVAAARDFLNLSGGVFKGSIGLVFVADEELGASGIQTYVASGARPDAVIIGEPTGMDVCVAHRGTTRYHLDVHGRSGHASRPDESVNAITTASRLAVLVDEYNRTALAARTHDILPPPSMAVTVMAGGLQTNTIPGHCRLTIDRRTLPGEEWPELVREIASLIGRLSPDSATVGDPDLIVGVPAGGPVNGGTLAAECACVLTRMGLPGTIRDFTASCDLAFVTQAGIDCVLVGPGNLSEAHTDDEFVSEDQLVLARRFYLQFLRHKLDNAASSGE